MGSDVVVLIPILHRAHRVRPVTQSIVDTCDARIVFLTTPDDHAVIQEIRTVGRAFAASVELQVPWYDVGDYARKINMGIRYTDEPYIFMGADDLEFQPGWLDAAKDKLAPGIGVVGTNDLANPRVMRGEHSTHSLITRHYVDTVGGTAEGGPGAALYEGYRHEFCDDELVGVAKHRGAFVMALDSHVRHRHPNFDASVPTDDMYDGQQARMSMDRRLYTYRRPLWMA